MLSWKQSRVAASRITRKGKIYRRRIGMIHYGFTKELDIPYEAVIEEITAALKNEGFGILTEINIKEKLKEKLGIEFRKYIILGACSPANAYKSLQVEENIGLMLPCNVIVYEKDGKTVLSVIKPATAMQMIDNAELKKIAEHVEDQLKQAFDIVN
jgi:uncharacterized protein (DUF302 family)